MFNGKQKSSFNNDSILRSSSQAWPSENHSGVISSSNSSHSNSFSRMLASLNKEEAEKISYENSQVIVRIWTSGFNPRKPGRNVGHVSVQARRYMSLWPQQERDQESSAKDREGLGIFKGISSEKVLNYEVDREYENRPPEYTFHFYSLDIGRIEDKFDELLNIGWSLLAITKDSASCASMAFDLLLAGGIRNLIGFLINSTISSSGSSYGSAISGKNSALSLVHATSSQAVEHKESSAHLLQGFVYSCELAVALGIKSPDALAELLKKAKEREFIHHPITKRISSDYGWKPLLSSRCCVM